MAYSSRMHVKCEAISLECMYSTKTFNKYTAIRHRLVHST